MAIVIELDVLARERIEVSAIGERSALIVQVGYFLDRNREST